ATDPTATEAGTTTGTFTVTRTGETSAALAVFYSVSGTATNEIGRATGRKGNETITAGVTTQTITVTPVDDAGDEPDETVIVTLTPDATYDIGAPSSDAVTSADNDPAQALPDVSIVATDPTATEAGTTTGTFTVTRTGDTSAALDVFYSVSGTATN